MLLSRVRSDDYGDLRAACAELMTWAAPGWYYSGVAVTKNFVASPHIDERDCTTQFAVSLGDFDGGELCVEADSQVGAHSTDQCVAVVNTRGRVARVDGRRVHWVRTFAGGDRFSLIFYDTTDRQRTPVLAEGVDAAWAPPVPAS